MGTGTTVYKSCSAQLNGEFYIFGGTGENKRQVNFKFNTLTLIDYCKKILSFSNQFKISRIHDCSLEKIGQLPHEFDWGTCGTYEFPEERVMFCFPYPIETSNKCFRLF